MTYAVSIVIFALGLALSIALHEVGHLVPAKAFKVRVTQYMIGFGPTLWSRQRGETEYGLKAVPLGGYIRMIGMYPPAKVRTDGARADGGRAGTSGVFGGLIEGARQQSMEEWQPGDAQRAFYNLRVHQKLIIMLGGPFMNLVIGTVLLTVVLTVFGTLQQTTRVDTVSQCVLPADAPQDATCSPSDPPAPSAAAGVLPGDVIVAFDGAPVAGWTDVRAAIREAGDRPVQLTVEREGAERTLTATPVVVEVPVLDDDEQLVLDADGNPTTVRAGFLGISPSQELVREPLSAVPGQIGSTIVGVAGKLLDLPNQLASVAGAAFGSGERDPAGLVSVVGAARFAGEVATYQPESGTVAFSERAANFLGILGGLNIALFVFNLVPLLPLDGGHVVGALWEGVRKLWARAKSLPDPGPVDVAKALPLAYGVAVLLLGMSALLIYADIVRPIRLTG